MWLADNTFTSFCFTKLLSLYVCYYEKSWSNCFRYYKFNNLDKGNGQSRSIVSFLYQWSIILIWSWKHDRRLRDKPQCPAVLAQEERGYESVCTKLEYVVAHNYCNTIRHVSVCVNCVAALVCNVCRSYNVIAKEF